MALSCSPLAMSMVKQGRWMSKTKSTSGCMTHTVSPCVCLYGFCVQQVRLTAALGQQRQQGHQEQHLAWLQGQGQLQVVMAMQGRARAPGCDHGPVMTPLEAGLLLQLVMVVC